METRKISVIVECAADKSFAARATESVNNILMIGYGSSAEDAIKDFYTVYEESKKLYVCPELEFEFKYDPSCFLVAYKNRLSLSGLQVITGINQKQLSHYLTGHRKPSAATSRKIAERVRNFGVELSKLEFA
jgi:hypothetical protein